MRWFRLFLTLFIISGVATVATTYWKTYHPEGAVVLDISASPSADETEVAAAEPPPEPLAEDGATVAESAPADDSVTLAAPKPNVNKTAERSVLRRELTTASGAERESSQTQDLANMLSIVSSVVSLLGTVISLVFAFGMRRTPTA